MDAIASAVSSWVEKHHLADTLPINVFMDLIQRIHVLVESKAVVRSTMQEIMYEQEKEIETAEEEIKTLKAKVETLSSKDT